MAKYRKFFNAKARAGSINKQNELKKQKHKLYDEDATGGGQEEEKRETEESARATRNNTEEESIVSKEENEKEERKRKLREKLYSENEKEEKLSRVKRKRLDKYVEHQIKREEKKDLLNKLEKTKVDTNVFVPSKVLGVGKQTRREEMAEAIELEKQNRGNERTKDILYEEREVRDLSDEEVRKEGNDNKLIFDDGNQEEIMKDSNDDNEHIRYSRESTDTPNFIDNRPATFGGQGQGFGFKNLQTIKKKKNKAVPKYTWRLRVDQQEKSKNKIDDENDFLSTDDESDNAEQVQDGSDQEGSEGSEGSEEEELYSDEHSERFDDESGQEDGMESSSGEESNDRETDSSVPDEDEEVPKLLKNKPKHTEVGESFKEWAIQHTRKLEGNDQEMTTPILSKETFEKYSKPTLHKEDFEDLDEEENFVPIDVNLERETVYVEVNRSPEIQSQRLNLPAYGEEHKIVEAVHHHDSVIICGETGSGKTTQVPQFLYEAGYGSHLSQSHSGMIAITQPRRVAAVSMAERVKNELGDHGDRVAYQIRFDSSVRNEGYENGTTMKFMTDGILLREMMSDLLLKKYSVIIIDEAHERNVNTDILIGMLTRVVKLRRQYHNFNKEKYQPLKIIIMSATLRITDFTENKLLFRRPPPVLKINSRQYPVSIHFNRRTRVDYIQEAFRKVRKIHTGLPPGGILVFLSGRNEINDLVKRLRREFPVNKKIKKDLNYDHYEEYPPVTLDKNTAAEVEDVEFSVDSKEKTEGLESEDSGLGSQSEEDDIEFQEETNQQAEGTPLYVLPLYSLLPTSEQVKVFQKPPKGCRLCVVATNVAETSITIPEVRYVVDSGRAKERKYNHETGVQSYEVDWISKASAEQRAGRAGRSGPGHCYRLYSSAVFEEYFETFGEPEISKCAVESVVLSMKSMGIDQVVNFPFPTPPVRSSLRKAENLLCNLGALDKETKQITDLGRVMSLFPLSPRFAKILIVGNQFDCLPYILAIVSALSVGDPFLSESEVGIAKEADDEETESASTVGEKERMRSLRTQYYRSREMFCRLDKFSDVLKILSAICAFDHVPSDEKDKFLREYFLRPKIVEEIRKLRKQIFNLVSMYTKKEGAGAVCSEKEFKLGMPDRRQVSAIKQMVCSGFIDQVAVRADLVSDLESPNKLEISRIPYISITPIPKGDEGLDSYLYIHPSSIITSSGSVPPSYLVFHSLNKGTGRGGKGVRLRMMCLSDISAKLLSNVAKNSSLLSYSKPLGFPYQPKLLSATKRECYVVPRYGTFIDNGTVIDLPVVKLTQTKKNNTWVRD